MPLLLATVYCFSSAAHRRKDAKDRHVLSLDILNVYTTITVTSPKSSQAATTMIFILRKHGLRSMVKSSGHAKLTRETDATASKAGGSKSTNAKKKGKKKSSSAEKKDLGLLNSFAKACTRNAPPRNVKSQANRYLAQKVRDESEQDSEDEDKEERLDLRLRQSQIGSHLQSHDDVTAQPSIFVLPVCIVLKRRVGFPSTTRAIPLLPPKSPGVQANHLALHHLSQLLTTSGNKDIATKQPATRGKGKAGGRSATPTRYTRSTRNRRAVSSAGSEDERSKAGGSKSTNAKKKGKKKSSSEEKKDLGPLKSKLADETEDDDVTAQPRFPSTTRAIPLLPPKSPGNKDIATKHTATRGKGKGGRRSAAPTRYTRSTRNTRAVSSAGSEDER
ncbi:hypothetical protein BT69DRAFT_1333770 [Atractiella rhizophila]|nr:hypothetical protein BT69DRAFT_1333770 [Atractiella rhizophila]